MFKYIKKVKETIFIVLDNETGTKLVFKYFTKKRFSECLKEFDNNMILESSGYCEYFVTACGYEYSKKLDHSLLVFEYCENNTINNLL